MLPTITQPKRYESIAERYGYLVSVSLPIQGISIADFLGYAYGKERFYWQDSQSNTAFAGFGVATELSAWGADRFQTIQRGAKELFQNAVVVDNRQPLAKPRLFGGFAFQDDFTPDNTWSVFYPAHFVLPHYQMVQVEDKAWLTLNIHLPADEQPDDIIPQLQIALEAKYTQLQNSITHHSPLITHYSSLITHYPMPFATWEQKIQEATQTIRTGEMQKVVLSRVCEIRFPERVAVDNALAYLNQVYADCYRFLFEPRPYHAFYGATPELLVKVEGKNLKTMGLAGSIRRGKTAEEDAQYSQQLLHDPKELHEHALVVETIKQRLQVCTTKLNVPSSPTVYQLSNIQHLYTPIEGELQEATGVLPLAELLHPTPALGGVPRDRAMAFIRSAEPVPRGWYAAPIGWIDCELDGAFSVAIRSAVSQENRVWLYAGAGIVQDSIPQKEWDETGLKFKPMLNALGIQEANHASTQS